MPSKALLVLLILTSATGALADVRLDGADDRLASNLAIDTFLSVSTGTMELWYRPTGPASATGNTLCAQGELLMGDDDPTGVDYGYIFLARHGDYGGLDRLCGMNYDAIVGFVDIPVAYTVNVWTHLVLVHSGGDLTLYKDGVPVQTVASGDTAWGVAANLSVGGAGAGASAFGEGDIVGVQIYATAVPASEIRVKAQSRLHRIGGTVRTGAWPLDDCLPGTSGDGIAFRDVSGNARDMVGDNGPDDAGLLCLTNTLLTYPWGPE